MTFDNVNGALLAENFYNAMRGFIVIEESGLPKYIEFLTEEQIDVILLSGLLSSLQSLAEIISEERIKTIETSNSKFIFELRENYFYVIWIEKTISNIEDYEPIITKIISRFEGASSIDIENKLLISNLHETPDYEVIGSRRTKFRSEESRYFDAYTMLQPATEDGVNVEQIAKELSGIDGVLVIAEDGDILHEEFPRGQPIFNVEPLRNFLVGLRKSIRNLDPGSLEEVTTQNYRFLIRDGQDYFYVFEAIKALINDEKLSKTLLKIMSRYEGLRRQNIDKIQILKDIDKTHEHEILGQLSLEMRERQSNGMKKQVSLDRQTSKMTFGDDENKWRKEREQLYSFMEIFKEIFIAGIISPNGRFFTAKKTSDINDWMQSVNEMELERLVNMTWKKGPNELVKMAFQEKQIRVIRIKEKSVLFVIFDEINVAAERYMLRLSNILARMSLNII